MEEMLAQVVAIYSHVEPRKGSNIFSSRGLF